MTTIYTGLDMAKLNLSLHLPGWIHDRPNTAAGHWGWFVNFWPPHRAPTSSVKPPSGYERDVVAALQEAHVPVSRSKPRPGPVLRPRHRQRAKNRSPSWASTMALVTRQSPSHPIYLPSYGLKPTRQPPTGQVPPRSSTHRAFTLSPPRMINIRP